MNFPADKNKIISFATQQQAFANNKNKGDILSALQNLEEREYKNVSDVTTALGMVY